MPLTSLVLDFDGTITERDLLQQICREFGDPAVVEAVDRQLHEGRITLREEITREYEPVQAPLDEVLAWVRERVRIRAGFPDLIALAQDRGWGVRVLSSGFEEIIRPVLEDIAITNVEILANSVDARADGWRVHWRDAAVCPVCGEPCKRASLPEGDVVYVGDGISDRCAALASSRIFATRGLARYLDEQHVAYEPFDDFHDIIKALAD
jgi:2-hydroxy-3-keto-5-methylthiopentenyl-1-phosphate phosphatase